MTAAPAWLNLDAFDIPQAAVEDLRQTITELRALVPDLERLVARAKTAVAAIDEVEEGKNLPDDVSAALREFTGESRLYDVLLVLGWFAAEISQSVITEERIRGI